MAEQQQEPLDHSLVATAADSSGSLSEEEGTTLAQPITDLSISQSHAADGSDHSWSRPSLDLWTEEGRAERMALHASPNTDDEAELVEDTHRGISNSLRHLGGPVHSDSEGSPDEGKNTVVEQEKRAVLKAKRAAAGSSEATSSGLLSTRREGLLSILGRDIDSVRRHSSQKKGIQLTGPPHPLTNYFAG